jgi:hypothetical protein
VEVFCPIEDSLFYQILSDITAKKILKSNKSNEFMKLTFDIVTGKTLQGSQKEAINPNEEKSYVYRQLHSLYRSACQSLPDVFRYRRKVIKRITPV